MITDEYVETTIVGRNSKRYALLGYGEHPQQTKIVVSIKHLTKKSSAKVNVQCDDCGENWISSYQKVSAKTYHRCVCCTRKVQYKNMDHTPRMSAARISMLGSNNSNYNPNKKEFASYVYEVRKYTDETYKLHLSTINPDNKPRTLCGVEGGYQLDHKVSIKYGFDNNLPAEVISSKDNLEMLPWKVNRSKHTNVKEEHLNILQGVN